MDLPEHLRIEKPSFLDGLSEDEVSAHALRGWERMRKFASDNDEGSCVDVSTFLYRLVQVADEVDREYIAMQELLEAKDAAIHELTNLNRTQGDMIKELLARKGSTNDEQ